VILTGTGCKTQGVALVNKIRMLDWAARKARKVERVPQRLSTMLSRGWWRCWTDGKRTQDEDRCRATSAWCLGEAAATNDPFLIGAM
jgi:hypothetical protein